MANGTSLEGWDDEGHAKKRARIEQGSISESANGERHMDIVALSHDDIKETKPNRMNTLAVKPGLEGLQAIPSMRKPRVRKGDLGKLSRILDLPVEVFCHIATYLRPLDLLYLARTSRELRGFLMSRSSKSIWNASILAIGMPSCPVDLSAPQYANLYFEKDCHACGRSRATYCVNTLRIRLCNDCHGLNIIQGKKLAEDAFGVDVSRIQEIYSLLPWSCMPIYSDTAPPLDLATAHANNSYLRYDFLCVIGDYLNIEPGSEERKAFVQKRHQIVEEIVKNAKEVSNWERKCFKDRVEADEALRAKRKAQHDRIEERLQASGYCKDEIEAMSFLCVSLPDNEKNLRKVWTRLLGQPKEVTERAWRSMRPKLEYILQEKRKLQRNRIVKQNREKRKTELLNRYRTYALLHGLKDKPITLCFVDLCEVPMVTNVVEENDCSAEITSSRWASIRDKLPQLINDHYNKIRHDCGALLVLALQKAAENIDLEPSFLNVDNTPDIVLRAYAFFGMYRELQPPSTFHDVVSLRSRKLFTIKDWGPWDPKRIQIEVLITQAACALLSSLGLSGDTTMEDMDALGMTLICNQCDPVSRNRMSWGYLVSHLCNEVKKYREKERYCLENGIPWKENHKVRIDDVRLAFYDPNFSAPPIESYTNVVNTTHAYCIYCWRLSIQETFRYEELYSAHMQTWCVNSEFDAPS
ncbi:hypothetical protein ACEPAH_8545 [Sanghuangporus vaninii]